MTAEPATLTLAQFLANRLDDDEAVARAATVDGHNWLVEEESIGLIPDDLDSGYLIFPRKAHAHHAATFDPAHVEAKRRIVEHHARVADPYDDDLGDTCVICADSGPDAQGWPCLTLRLLALPYAGHEDYRAEWAP